MIFSPGYFAIDFLVLNELESGLVEETVGPLGYQAQDSVVVFLVQRNVLENIGQDKFVEVDHFVRHACVLVGLFVLLHAPLKSKLQKVKDFSSHPVGQVYLQWA
jgi:hypothetical protein